MNKSVVSLLLGLLFFLGCGSVAEPTETAIIEGSLSYPSEGIPNMKVCAEGVDGEGMYCTETILEDEKYTYGKGYLLELPAGNYLVYAQLTTFMSDGMVGYKAYYTAYATEPTIEDTTSRLSHDPLVVTVTADSHLQDIDPDDWEAPTSQ